MASDSRPAEGAPTADLFVPAGLRCEYQDNPLGLDVLTPRFSWLFTCGGRGRYQTAYRILVAGSLEKLSENIGDCFDSGKVTSGQSVNIDYSGRALVSRATYFWKVQAWDQDGRTAGCSEPARFETGILRPEDWSSGWMGFPAGKNGKALYFHKTFRIGGAAVRARAYVASPGYHELYLNGLKAGDSVLDPAPSRHDRRLFYVTYDLDELVRPGDNVIGLIAGNGWFGSPRLLFQMEITLADGSVETVSSDPVSNWLVTDGPIIANSIYDGETYDARLEKDGWNTAASQSRRGTGWRNANQIEGTGGSLTSQLIEPIKMIQELLPVRITNPGTGVYVFDLGQNIAGWARIKVRGERGKTVVLKYAESLYDSGFVNQENLLTANATDVYILKGGGVEQYQPRFTYHGFRYVEMTGFPGEPAVDSLIGVVVRSSVAKVGDFTCSSTLLNQIHTCVTWTESGNLHGIPTDCPQRDERMGWLNDATVRAEEAVYNFSLARLYTKWLDDIADTQDAKTGAIADTAPFRWGRRPGDPVDSSFLIIPWLMYLHYNDKRILEKHYTSLKKWVGFLLSETEDNIVKYSYYGDWAPPVAESVWADGAATPVSRNTPGRMISTGYLFYDLQILAKIAAVLQKKEDAAEFSRRAAEIKDSFNQAFYQAADHLYAGGSQAGMAFALYMGLVPDGETDPVLKQLVRNVVDVHDYHLTTGNLCTKYLMEVLTENGQEEVAYALATQTTYPSWGYMLSKGATTIWERWEHATGSGMNSHNHPMMASIGSWFYKYLAGILPDIRDPGFGKVVIRPHFPRDLNFVQATLQSMRGPIHLEWTRSDRSLNLAFSIPANSQAEIHLPACLGPVRMQSILEDGQMIWRDDGSENLTEGVVRVLKNEAGICLNLLSGTYHFQLI